ncbi:unnamed protein product [Cuscuta epithymum]|uniref:Hexosyltransferase n=1 Tax=Cuscuta epithymum TaxID=186058 RepID=A0AAV0DYE1_9ASTE|nr:unnamed protein product [Cuscuta epithymum]CAH9131142.1 unnamed protein product [Cuscuta epithymum]
MITVMGNSTATGTLGETLARHQKKPRVYIGCMKSGPALSQKHVLHKYANEDVSLGSWFIGLDVHHTDGRRLCCGTLPGNISVVSFDWNCSGICRSADRIKEVHQWCGAEVTPCFFPPPEDA